MSQNKKPAAGTAGFRGVGDTPKTFPPIIPSPPPKNNPHLYALRRQAETFLTRARAANNRQSCRRHFAVYLAVLAAEAKRGQL